MNRLEEENTEKSKIKKVFINTLARYLLIPLTFILTLIIAVAIWTAGASAGRRL